MLEASGRICRGSVAGKGYSTYLMREATLKSAKWDPDNDNPPVSACAAMKLATAARRTVAPDSTDWKWVLHGISLVHDTDIDKWFWEAHFYAPGSGNNDDYLVVIVLMDGSVVKPVADSDRVLK